MTAQETIQAYIDRFGGFPYFMMMGMGDEKIAEVLGKALKEGKPIEIEPEDGVVY